MIEALKSSDSASRGSAALRSSWRYMATVAFWLLFLVFVGAFAAQVATRVRLIAAGAEHLLPRSPRRPRRAASSSTSLLQRQTIVERPVAGLAHAFVFWGFVAFGGYTAVEFLHGLGIVDLTGTRLVRRLSAGADAVRRRRPRRHRLPARSAARSSGRSALGTTVSVESIVIALFIATLMVTFLLTFRLDEATLARTGELVGAHASSSSRSWR